MRFTVLVGASRMRAGNNGFEQRGQATSSIFRLSKLATHTPALPTLRTKTLWYTEGSVAVDPSDHISSSVNVMFSFEINEDLTPDIVIQAVDKLGFSTL